jgi:hypothetical protein
MVSEEALLSIGEPIQAQVTEHTIFMGFRLSRGASSQPFFAYYPWLMYDPISWCIAHPATVQTHFVIRWQAIMLMNILLILPTFS